MPIYEYACPGCGHNFERMQKISDPMPACPACGAEVQKKVSMTSFHLKGGGWYVTDYKSRPGAEGKNAEGKPAEGAPAEGKVEGKEAAKETPADTKAEPAKAEPAKAAPAAESKSSAA